jgi:hypothetical protein
MMFLSADKIQALTASKKVSRVEVPEFGGHVFVRVMSLGERIRFEEAANDSIELQVLALIAFTACDKDGKLAYSLEEVKALSDFNSVATMRIYQEALRLNKVTDADIENAAKKS